MALSYGERVAMELAIKRSKTPSTSKKQVRAKRKSTPTLDTYPMQFYVYKHTQDAIDWDKTDISSELAERLLASPSLMQMLVLGTGSGKTSIAVAAVAKLGLPFMVVAPPAVVGGGGWQETIASYNSCHDKKLNPYAITTFQKFTNFIADTKMRAKFKSEFPNNGVIVIDEVHNYKSPTSKRSMKMRLLTGYKKIGLTATPLTNDIISDMCSYLIMSGRYRSKSDFIDSNNLNRFIDKFHRLNVYDSQGRIDTRLWPEYFDVREQMSDIIFSPPYKIPSDEFPELTTTVIQLPQDWSLTEDLLSISKAYDNRQFENAIDVANAMIQRICTSDMRLDKCREIVEGEGVVQPLIFFQHTAVRDALLKLFPKAQILDGSHHMVDIDLNRTDPILIQYRAGAEGVEFKNSNTTIFFENQYSYISLKQAVGRNVRRGSTAPVSHYMMVSSAPFDQEIFGKISQKEEVNPEELEKIVQNSLAKTSASW